MEGWGRVSEMQNEHFKPGNSKQKGKNSKEARELGMGRGRLVNKISTEKIIV